MSLDLRKMAEEFKNTDGEGEFEIPVEYRSVSIDDLRAFARRVAAAALREWSGMTCVGCRDGLPRDDFNHKSKSGYLLPCEARGPEALATRIERGEG